MLYKNAGKKLHVWKVNIEELPLFKGDILLVINLGSNVVQTKENGLEILPTTFVKYFFTCSPTLSMTYRLKSKLKFIVRFRLNRKHVQSKDI